MTSRFVACPAREKGESGRAFVERMLAALNTGGATALPTPEMITGLGEYRCGAGAIVTEWCKSPDEAVRSFKSQAKALDAKPKIKVEAETVLCTHGPLPPCKSPQAYQAQLTPWCVWVEQRLKWKGPPCEPFGPTYPALPGANKWRRQARMRELTRDENREYGQAVLDGINALNARLLDREVAPFRSNSASGTFHNNGKDILKAINEQNRRAATSY